nr:PQQ-like beta-propeller repeat protein [Thermotoga sp. SG1]
MFAFDYRIEENGVLYFLGDATPTEVELEIVQEWKDLPVVTLVYDGPGEYEGLVENLLTQDGVLTGVGTPLIVKLRVKEDLVAFQIVFEDKKLDNFENPVTSNLFPEQFREVVRKIFSQLEVPSRFFLIEYRDGKFEKKIAQTHDFPGKKAPVVIVPVWKQKHVLEIGNYREVVDEGFYQIGGKTIYVGRDISLKSVPGLYEGVDMVFLDGEKEYIYKDGFLRMGEKVLKIQEPVDVVDEKVITGYRIGEQEVDDTILFRWNDFVLTASGVLIGINGNWTWQVSRAPVEFSFRDGRMYILDVCGFLRSYDLKTRRLLWERRIEGAWGLDTSRDRVFVGVGSNVVVLNAEDGETIEILEAEDFAVWEDELLIYKEGKISGENVGDGFFIRNFGTPLFISEGKVLFFGSEKKIYRNVEKIRVFQWGTVIKEGNELWLIRRD